MRQLNESSLWQIAVNVPLNQLFTYEAPQGMKGLSPGVSVRVPIGLRQGKGVVVGTIDSYSEPHKLKSIITIDEERPYLNEIYFNWLKWVSNYYRYALGLVFQLAFPPLKRKTKKTPKKTRPIPVEPLKNTIPWTGPKLTDLQEKCVCRISQQSGFQTHLIFGVTGSGKTEVYLNLLRSVLQRNQQALVLVPEISLTPQLIHRFSTRFPNLVAFIHSHLTPRQRTEQWWEMVEEKKKILIGVRSALFCPIPKLGMIIIDEEHEPSFKQNDKLKIHARDAAVMLAQMNNCPILLGSATPSMESWNNCLEGKYQLHEMSQRIFGQDMPDVRVVDLREERRQKAKEYSKNSKAPLPYWLSRSLHDALIETLGNRQQSALFLNRRGMAQIVTCYQCGKHRECPNCAVSLTLHASVHLVCHYCEYHESLTDECPECKQGALSCFGIGTELIENDIRELFPSARVARADRDEIQSRRDLEDFISRMEKHEIDILIGTQMIAKGLDFPNLTLVGLVLADVTFNLPDFRATERSFQLLTQVGGRAGRHSQIHGQCGKVIIQTLNPKHLSICHAQNSDYVGFASTELGFRQELSYPPFGRLATLRIQALDQKKAEQTADLYAVTAREIQKQFRIYDRIEILGPAAAPLARIKRKYRFQILIKAHSTQTLSVFHDHLFRVLSPSGVGNRIEVITDIDPNHLL